MIYDIIEDKVRLGLRCCGLRAGESRLGVALSGGADSVALLAALRSLGYTCEALHCNYHLRGDESDRDCRIALAAASATGAGWHVADMDVEARTRATGESVEMACRELRYGWFASMCAELRLSAVAVAHHRDDRVETFLLNATRGTGLRGLASMRRRRDIYIRPMLGCKRHEIEEYLRKRGLSYAVDSSNLTDDYMRNRVRHHVLPALERVRPDALDRLSDTIDRLDDTRTLYDHMVRRMRDIYVGQDGTIDLDRLITAEGDASAQLLYEFVSPYGLGMDHVRRIMSASGESGRRFGPLLLDRGRLVVSRISGTEQSDQEWIPGEPPLTVTEIRRHDFAPERDPLTIYLDAGAFADSSARWMIRPWRKGDRLRPFGMKGSRLVSDILSDAHYSIDRKKQVRLLTRGGIIIWVIGLRASDHFKVTDHTERIVKITAPHDGVM